MPPTRVSRTCAEAARGLEGATKGVRAPESEVFDALQARCREDVWPVTAIECFATMREGELGRCAGELPKASRDALFAELTRGEDDRAGIAVARARLEQVTTSVESCKRLADTAIATLACEAVSVDERAHLGQQVADLVSVPTHRLSPDEVRQLSETCEGFTSSLHKELARLACPP